MLILLLLKYQSYRSFLLLFSCSVVSDSLRPHWLQHARLPCPSPSPRACSDSCQLSWWCHPTILSSVVSFSSCPQSFPASGSFLMSRLFGSGGQSIGASASVLPMNIHDWFPLGLTGWSSCSPMDSQESSSASRFESINSVVLCILYGPALRTIHDSWKDHSLEHTDLRWQRYVFAF